MGVVSGKTWKHLDLAKTLGGSIKDARAKLTRTAKGYCPSARGERNSSARITAEDVLFIRNLAKFGISQKNIALQFGISQSNVSAIILRKSWDHV